MIDLDVHYARRKSLFMDLKIITMTIPALVFQAIEVKRSKKALTAATDRGIEPRRAVGQKV